MELVEKYFVDFSATQKKQFAALKDLYIDWNEKINVISRKDMDNFYEHHVLHSLSIATQFEFTKGMQVMDLGCGGGFPGIPLAIVDPQRTYCLLDSNGKKIRFLQQVVVQLGLKKDLTL